MVISVWEAVRSESRMAGDKITSFNNHGWSWFSTWCCFGSH